MPNLFDWVARNCTVSVLPIQIWRPSPPMAGQDSHNSATTLSKRPSISPEFPSRTSWRAGGSRCWRGWYDNLPRSSLRTRHKRITISPLGQCSPPVLSAYFTAQTNTITKLHFTLHPVSPEFLLFPLLQLHLHHESSDSSPSFSSVPSASNSFPRLSSSILPPYFSTITARKP